MFKNKKLKSLTKSPFFILTVLILIYFFPIFLQNYVFYSGDILTIYLPFKKFLFRNLSRGIFPLWNPNVFSGHPFFADMTLGTYYPPSFILFFSQSMKNVSFLMVFHFFISAFFMYKLGKFLKLSKEAALLSSICYTFSGLMINYIADPQRFFVIALYPLFYFTYLKALKKRNLTWIIIAAFSLSLQLFAGHIQYVFIELLFCLLLLFLCGVETFSLFILVSIIILAFLFSSISFLPMLEFLPFTTRTITSQYLSIYKSFSLNPITLVRFLFAHFWGVRNEGSAWGTMDTSSIGYLGFIPLVLIFLSLKKLVRRKEALIFLLISLLSLFISFGTYLPFFSIFVNIVPIFKIFRNPMVFLAVYTFSTSILSGFSWDFLSFKKNHKILLSFLFLLLSLSTAFLYLVILTNKTLPYSLLVWTAQVVKKQLSLFHTQEVDFLIAKFILTNFLVVALLASLFFWFRNKYFLLLLIFLDLFLFTRGNFYTVEASWLEKQNNIASFLKQNLGTYRYLSSSEVVPYSGMNDYFGMLSFQPPFAKEGKKLSDSQKKKRFLHELTLLPPNFSTFYGLSTINGYTSFVVKKYNDLFQESKTSSPTHKKMAKYNPYIEEPKPEMILSKVDLSKVSFNDEIFDRLSVKYIVTDRDLELVHHELAYKDGDISVYENENVQPRLVLLDEENNIIEEPVIVKEDATEIEIKTKKKGKLVLYDVNYPGWKAFVEGKGVPILSYEQIFRSIDIDKEESRVLFKFQPLSFYWGASISVVSLFVALLYLIKHPRGVHSATPGVLKSFLLLFFFFFLFPKTTFAKQSTFLIIHQLRGEENCCHPGSLALIQNLKNRKDIHNLSFAWALRFDALEDDRYIDPLRNFGEMGLLLEITPNLASKSSVLYKGKIDGNDWYFAKNAFLIGYTQAERKKIIDTLFESFRKKFGYYPSFTVSWMIDAWSLDYISNVYQVKLHELTKEQYETDAYTLYGGVFNAPYYPSKNHPLIPGQELDRLDIVMIRQTISDPLQNYGSQKAYYTSQPNDYLENPKRADTLYFQGLVEDTISQSSEFQFGVLGFENSYSWEKYGEEYLKQLDFISEKQREGKLRTISPDDYVSEFKKDYQENPSFYLVKNFVSGEKLGTLWYFGKTYRARVLLKDNKLILDDLRIYSQITDPYKSNPAEADYSYWIVPYLIDGSQQYSLKTSQGWLERLNHPRGSPKGSPWGEGNSKALGPPGGPLTSDILTSPFGIILGEDRFNVKTDKQDVVEIEFTGDRKGIVRFLPEEILIDKSFNPSFSKPYNFQIGDLFDRKEEINLQFGRQFNFTIRKNLNHPKGSPTMPAGRQEGSPWGIETPSRWPNGFILKIHPEGLLEGGGSKIALGWQRDDNFIPLLEIQKDNDQFILIPQTKEKDLSLLNPMFQPDMSDLPIDQKKSVFYWNNKEAVAGRNPVRLFILPLNELSRSAQVKEVKVTFNTDQPIDVTYPSDYSYRITPWFVDISSENPLKIEVTITADEKEVVKDIPIEFVIDCQENIQDCLKKPTQMVRYILVLLNEQKMRLLSYLKSKN